FVPRGAGTGLSGGTMPPEGAVMLGLSRLNRILEVDYRNRCAIVETGVVNAHLSDFVAAAGFGFAPDPSSGAASTIGGNVAENAGGPHTLKYGVTVNHVLGLEYITPQGEVLWLGGKTQSGVGYDLVGLLCGSEGTFGVCTKAVVKLSKNASAFRTLLAVFATVRQATETISGVIAAGIVPAAMEMMDQPIIEAAEAAFGFGLPTDAGAVLIMEVDGPEAGLDALASRIERICSAHGARSVRIGQSAEERAELWKVRKRSAGAVGRLSPSFVTQDGVIPRTKIPEMLDFIAGVSRTYGLRIANLMHAGDGNLHPIILFDERDPKQVEQVLAASHDILHKCVEMGGTVTGEHGIGVEKMDFIELLFSPTDVRIMEQVKAVFNADGLCNPGKIFPTDKGCRFEVVKPRRGVVGL
ncbi:MAG TPA: FAD-linked oxidase C-terminal domain-containing protein, partial [Limnochordia bacterium]|nr:FAD-linked oxidase C-terminal domain-containing protein [Limnochordia bacterium]